MKSKVTNVEHFTDGIEDPAMRIDLLLVLGLDDQNNLYRNKVQRIIILRKNELWL